MAKKTSFEDRMRELEKIVRELDGGELSLEQAVDHYQKGVKLHQELRAHLDRMEKKIETLTAPGAAPAAGAGGEDGDPA